jgi:hypothetical protein
MSSTRTIVYRKLRAATDPAERDRLVREFTANELRFLLEQLEGARSGELAPESIAKALRDVASVLVLPPAGVDLAPPAVDPSDAAA